MRIQIPVSQPEIAAPQGDPHSNLAKWLLDPRTQEYFGDTFKLRADCLAAVITGDNLAAVARRHGVTRAAASKSARRAQKLFGNLRLTPRPN